MSTNPVSMRNLTDTYVDSAFPSRNFSDAKRIGLKTGAAYGFIYANRPFPLGATIVSATLHLYTNSSWGGASATLTAKRVSAPWKASKVTSNAMPGVVGTGGALTKTSTGALDEWAIDVTAQMQAVSDGGIWYGFRIETTNASLLFIGSTDGLDAKPTIDVTWSTAPQAPTTLSPSGGRATSVAKPVLRFDFTDDLGNTTMQAAQVQLNATNVWTDPTVDTGTVLTTEPELDLSTFSYTRTVSVTKALSSPTLTEATSGVLVAADIGASITGTGIPGSTTITAASASTSTATMSANATSAGTITATVVRTYAGLTAGASTYWRVRVQDASGLWSGWSDGALFTRTAKPTLTITNPAVSPNNFVSEWTPPLAWTFGGTQTQWRLLVTDVTDRTLVYYDSGRQKGTQSSLTLPKGVLKDSRNYSMIIRVYDSVDREGTPGDPAFISAVRDFTVALDATTNPVTGLSATNLTTVPGVQLDFSRATAPDSFTVTRDGVTIDAQLLAADLLVSGTAYRYTDKSASRESHTWSVQAIVNGKASATNPTVSATPTLGGIWLIDDARGLNVCIANGSSSTFDMGEDAETYFPVGSSKGVRITQALRGWEGNVSGLFVDYNGKTAAQWADIMHNIRSRPGRTLLLHAGPEAFSVVVGNVKVAPMNQAGAPATTVAVSFDFWNTDSLVYDTRL